MSKRFRSCAAGLAPTMAMTVSALLLSGGCASLKYYVEASPYTLPPADDHRAARPEPVQLRVVFSTRGVPNPRGTEYVQRDAFTTVVESGLFSEVGTGPVPGGATLTLSIDDVPDDKAFRKGMVHGLTLGLSRSFVIDSYVCTAVYTRTSGSEAVTRTAKHSIISTTTNLTAPSNTRKVTGSLEATTIMTHQVINHALDDLGTDPRFQASPVPDK